MPLAPRFFGRLGKIPNPLHFSFLDCSPYHCFTVYCMGHSSSDVPWRPWVVSETQLGLRVKTSPSLHHLITSSHLCGAYGLRISRLCPEGLVTHSSTRGEENAGHLSLDNPSASCLLPPLCPCIAK